MEQEKRRNANNKRLTPFDFDWNKLTESERIKKVQNFLDYVRVNRKKADLTNFEFPQKIQDILDANWNIATDTGLDWERELFDLIGAMVRTIYDENEIKPTRELSVALLTYRIARAIVEGYPHIYLSQHMSPSLSSINRLLTGKDELISSDQLNLSAVGNLAVDIIVPLHYFATELIEVGFEKIHRITDDFMKNYHSSAPLQLEKGIQDKQREELQTKVESIIRQLKAQNQKTSQEIVCKIVGMPRKTMMDKLELKEPWKEFVKKVGG